MREWLSGRALPCQGKCRGFESRLPLHKWYHRQAVRQRSAKPLFPGSNPGGTSKYKNKNPPVDLVVFHITGKTLHYRQHEIVRSLTMPIANLTYFLNGSFISYIVICSIILSSFSWFAMYCCIAFLFFPTVST